MMMVLDGQSGQFVTGATEFKARRPKRSLRVFGNIFTGIATDELYCLEPEGITNWFEHCLGFEQDPSLGTAEEIGYATGY